MKETNSKKKKKKKMQLENEGRGWHGNKWNCSKRKKCFLSLMNERVGGEGGGGGRGNGNMIRDGSRWSIRGWVYR